MIYFFMQYVCVCVCACLPCWLFVSLDRLFFIKIKNYDCNSFWPHIGISNKKPMKRHSRVHTTFYSKQSTTTTGSTVLIDDFKKLMWCFVFYCLVCIAAEIGWPIFRLILLWFQTRWKLAQRWNLRFAHYGSQSIFQFKYYK